MNWIHHPNKGLLRGPSKIEVELEASGRERRELWCSEVRGEQPKFRQERLFSSYCPAENSAAQLRCRLYLLLLLVWLGWGFFPLYLPAPSLGVAGWQTTPGNWYTLQNQILSHQQTTQLLVLTYLRGSVERARWSLCCGHRQCSLPGGLRFVSQVVAVKSWSKKCFHCVRPLLQWEFCTNHGSALRQTFCRNKAK